MSRRIRRAGGSGSSPIGLTYIAASYSQTQNITIPATAAEGDLAILFELHGGGSDATPSGWTNWSTAASGAHHCYKILASGDPGSTVTDGSPGSFLEKGMMIWRPTRAITTVTPQDVASEVTTGNPSAQTINASGGSVGLLVLACAMTLNNPPPPYPTFTAESPAFATNVRANDCRMGGTSYTSAPADHTVDTYDYGGGYNHLGSAYFELS